MRSSPLRNTAVRRIVISTTVSGLGSSMTTLALPWFILITTGSVTRMGLVYAMEVLPVALLGVPSGALVARFGARRTLVTGNTLLAVLIGAIPLLHLLGMLPFWLLLLIVTMAGAVATPYSAAQFVLLPDVLGEDEATVAAGTALVESSSWGVMFAGPAIAGFLIAVVGSLGVIWIDSATFVFSSVFLLGLPRPTAAGRDATPRDRDVLAGARYALSDGLTRRIMILAMGFGLLLPFLLMSLPLIAKQQYAADPHTAGGLLAAWGAGAFVGTFVVARLVKRFSSVAVCVWGTLGLAVPMWLMPLHEPAFAAAAVLGSIGAFGSLINTPIYTVLTTRPPRHLRPHVMTCLVTASSLIRPASYALGGRLFSTVGLEPIQFATAIGFTVCAVFALTLTRYRGTVAGEPVDGADPHALDSKQGGTVSDTAITSASSDGHE